MRQNLLFKMAILKSNLAVEGAVAKITGVKSPVITGPARVFESEEDCLKAILACNHLKLPLSEKGIAQWVFKKGGESGGKVAQLRKNPGFYATG